MLPLTGRRKARVEPLDSLLQCPTGRDRLVHRLFQLINRRQHRHRLFYRPIGRQCRLL